MDIKLVLTVLFQSLVISHSEGMITQQFHKAKNIEPLMSIQHAPLAVHEASSTMGCTVKCQLTRCCLSIVVKKNTIAGGLKYMCYLHDIFYPEYSLEAKPGVEYLHNIPVNGMLFFLTR